MDAQHADAGTDLEMLLERLRIEKYLSPLVPKRRGHHADARLARQHQRRAIGDGLRRMHDALPVADCPFSWALETRFSRIRAAADRWLIGAAPEDDLVVVCHGDACSPNTLLDERGRYLAHVDLGRLGVADRWADLAVATYSLGWNYSGQWEHELLDAYGIERDEERIEYYRCLWDAT